jgi:hypothetical protein
MIVNKTLLFSSASFLLIITIEDENPRQNVYITSNLHSDSIGIIEKTAYFNYKFNDLLFNFLSTSVSIGRSNETLDWEGVGNSQLFCFV